MVFTAESILLSLFTALIAGIGSYFGYYVKARAELKAATEDLKQHIANQAEATRTIECEKLSVATEGTMGAEARQCIYSLVSALQCLLHSMCWIGWDTAFRRTVRADLAKLYDSDAHRLLPEISARQAVLSRLDSQLLLNTDSYIRKLFQHDVCIGEAIVLSETDMPAAVAAMADLFEQSSDLKIEIDNAFLVLKR